MTAKQQSKAISTTPPSSLWRWKTCAELSRQSASYKYRASLKSPKHVWTHRREQGRSATKKNQAKECSPFRQLSGLRLKRAQKIGGKKIKGKFQRALTLFFFLRTRSCHPIYLCTSIWEVLTWMTHRPLSPFHRERDVMHRISICDRRQVRDCAMNRDECA